MKDSEFIELLNLYLDHEISAADAARLEAEVQSNPARRKVYGQYCRMQKACKLFVTDFATEPTQAHDAAQLAAEKKIVAFDVARAQAAGAGRVRAGNLYTVGAFAAAAACVAIIFVGHSRQTTEAAAGAAIAAMEQTHDAAPRSISAPSAGPAETVVIDLKPMMIASPVAETGPRALGGLSANRTHATLVADRQLRLTGNAQTDAMLTEAMHKTSGRFAWIEQVQLPPVQRPVPLSELRFDARPAVMRTEGRALGNRGAAETTDADPLVAFQFIK